MNINKIKNGNALVVEVEGRVDSLTAPQLEQALQAALEGVNDFTLDLAKMDFISSAGLRVVLWANWTMQKQGKMKVINVSELVREVFDLTGFSDILTIE